MPFFAFVLVMLVSAASSAAPLLRDVRVRVSERKTSLTLTGTAITYMQSLPPRRYSSPLQIELLGPGRWRLNSDIIQDTEPRFEGQALQVDGVEVPPRLLLSLNEVSGFDSIVMLPFETYLLDVVASEMPSTWPLVALKAQSVAARTYAQFMMNTRVGGRFDLDSSTEDQVFRYKQHERVTNSAGIVSAVTATAGRMLNDANGQAIKAFFHAHCGGESEDKGAVWPEQYPRDPNFQRQKDGECATSGAWTAEFSKTEMATAFGASEVTNIATRLNAGSNRVETVDVSMVKNGAPVTVTLSSQDFRKTLGYTKLRSTIFTFQQSGDKYSFTGRGFGHGVGLCQTGARWMAAAGSTYEQILARYY